MKICPGFISGNETAMTIRHQSPFKEGEVLQIQKRLLDSARSRHAENMVQREAYRALFGDDWLEGETVDADLDDDEWSADLDALLEERLVELPATLRKLIRAKSGVNAKSSRSNRRGQSLSTPGRAGLIAGFNLIHAERVVAISKLHSDIDHDQLQTLQATAAFIQKLAREYQGTGKLPDWDKFVSPKIKQFFRIFHQCRKPDSKNLTIRLDQKTAEAALAAPRGPANYLAEIIKRTLAKLGINTGVAFNLEFNHTGRTENHPAHLHGALCVPDDKVDEVAEALRSVLAMGYRQRYKNVAIHIETPLSARSWAAYCIKEYEIAAITLDAHRGKKTRPDYATQELTREAKAFYEVVGAWLGES